MAEKLSKAMLSPTLNNKEITCCLENCVSLQFGFLAGPDPQSSKRFIFLFYLISSPLYPNLEFLLQVKVVINEIPG